MPLHLLLLFKFLNNAYICYKIQRTQNCMPFRSHFFFWRQPVLSVSHVIQSIFYIYFLNQIITYYKNLQGLYFILISYKLFHVKTYKLPKCVVLCYLIVMIYYSILYCYIVGLIAIFYFYKKCSNFIQPKSTG